MEKDIRKQYNTVAEEFSKNHINGDNSNNKNQKHFYSYLENFSPKITSKLLDLCCGDGADMNIYKKMGFDVTGIDISESMIKIAKEKFPGLQIDIGYAENLPYMEKSFDIVVSKYAIMTSKKIQPIFDEVYRVLKPKGYFIYLVTHPFRQYFEKVNISADYFEQQIVTSNIFNGSVSLKEPTHTFNEYFSKNFLEKFEVLRYEESFDPAAERIENRIYPGYFILLCRKK